MRDIDSALRTRILKILFFTFPPTGFLGFIVCAIIFGNSILGLLVGGLIGILASIIAYIIIENIGSFGVNFLYGKRKPIYSDFEIFEGEIHQAQHHKSKKEYHKALILVNEILKKAPDLPEALYLKSQILWEGYHKAVDAKNTLEKILVELPDKTETYPRWAHTLIDNIDSEKMPA